MPIRSRNQGLQLSASLTWAMRTTDATYLRSRWQAIAQVVGDEDDGRHVLAKGAASRGGDGKRGPRAAGSSSATRTLGRSIFATPRFETDSCRSLRWKQGESSAVATQRRESQFVTAKCLRFKWQKMAGDWLLPVRVKLLKTTGSIVQMIARAFSQFVVLICTQKLRLTQTGH